MIKKTLLLLFSITIIACNKDDDSKKIFSETDLNLVTGINLLPETGPSPIRLGNPNIFIDKNMISIYPNPVVKILNIESYETITDVWVVPASGEKIFQEVDFEAILDSNTYTEIEINNNSVLSVNENSYKSVILNFENLAPGYYRVFVKTNDSIMWDNVLYSKDDVIQDLLDFWE